MGELDRGRHKNVRFTTGIAKHNALITSTFIFVVRGIDPKCNICGLGVNMVFKNCIFPVKAGLRRRGSWTLTVVDPSGSRDVTFDADGGEAGWNSLGTFEIADGSVRVEVSNEVEGKGRYVIADAIRWSPISGRRAIDPDTAEP